MWSIMIYLYLWINVNICWLYRHVLPIPHGQSQYPASTRIAGQLQDMEMPWNAHHWRKNPGPFTRIDITIAITIAWRTSKKTAFWRWRQEAENRCTLQPWQITLNGTFQCLQLLQVQAPISLLAVADSSLDQNWKPGSRGCWADLRVSLCKWKCLPNIADL